MPKINESTKQARRQQILASALSCFARTGYHATTMADVAAAAGVSKGTPYLYFPSKEALFVALQEEWNCGLEQRVDATLAALAGKPSARQELRTIATTVGEHVVQHADMCRVLMEARILAGFNPTIAEAVRAGDALAHERVLELFRAGAEAGEWPRGTDPNLQARLFVAALEGLMGHWHLAPASFSWEEAADTLLGPTRPDGSTRREDSDGGQRQSASAGTNRGIPATAG